MSNINTSDKDALVQQHRLRLAQLIKAIPYIGYQLDFRVLNSFNGNQMCVSSITGIGRLQREQLGFPLSARPFAQRKQYECPQSRLTS